MNWFFYVLLGLILLLSGLLVAAFIASKFQTGAKKEALDLKKSLPSANRRSREGMWGISLYPHYSNIPGINRVLDSIEQRLRALSAGEDRSIKDSSAKFVTYGIAVCVGFLVLSFLLSSSLQTRLVILLSGVYFCTILFDFLIGRLEKRSLYEEVDSFQKIKDAYHSTKMTTKSVDDAAEKSGPIAADQLRKIVKVWKDPHPNDALVDYYDVAPNDHMRKIAGIGQSVAIFGDGEADHSQFLDGVSKILEEIRMDITKREKLDYRTSGFKLMAIFPVFFIEPLKNWGISNMDQVSWYFSSTLGLYAMVLVYLSIIVSFTGSSLARVVSSGNRNTVNEGRLLKWILKSLFVRRMVNRVAPSDGNTLQSVKILRKYNPMLKSANSGLTVREFYLRKIIFAFMGFLVMFSVQLGTHHLSRLSLLDESSLTEKANTSIGYQQLQKRIFEHKVLQKYGYAEVDDKAMIKDIQSDPQFDRFSAMEESTNNYPLYLVGKVREFQGEVLKWYDILIALLVGFVAFQVPNWVLLVKSSLRRWDMQTEVDGFYTNILILSKNRRVMVKDILEWMHRYSSIFEPQLLRCLVRYEQGAEKALEGLKLECNFPPMERVVERLKASVNSITIREAFEDLEGERRFSLEQRELENEKTVERRAKIASVFGWTPIVVLMVTYLLIPFVLVMVTKFSEISVMTKTLGG